VLAVPLMRARGAYGAIFLYRRAPGLFRDDQVALVETFARQAAIAIDNVRLFNQTKEALDQQTAISEILRVISSSPTDVQPVMDAVARARRSCATRRARMCCCSTTEARHDVQHSRGDINAIPHGYSVALDRGDGERPHGDGRALRFHTPTSCRCSTPSSVRHATTRSSSVPRRALRAADAREQGLRRPVRVASGAGAVLADQVALLETFARQRRSRSTTSGCSTRPRRRSTSRPRSARSCA
jgi:hypothetical protein